MSVNTCKELRLNIYKNGGITLKIKLLYALDERKFEEKVNNFLAENKDKIEVVEIQWKWVLFHYAMIMYKEV